MPLVDFDKVNSSALAALPWLLREWFPAGVFDGGEFKVGDWNGGKGRSLSINIKKGFGKDFAGDDGAPDPVGIFAKRFGLDRVEAAHQLADRLGLGDAANLPKYEENRRKASAQLPAVREEAPPPADPEKLAKVEEILGQCVTLKGTPGQAYLLSRGITGAPGFKWQPRAGGKPGGYLVAVGTDDTGAPMCVQRIAVTGDGAKNKSAQVAKRTNGHAKGNPVRIPPAKGREDDPLLLTEGPEDALTLRLATGLEVWACLSVSNMGHAPVPAGRHVIVCRDNDAPDSDADKALAKALCHLLDRGITPACARPPAGVKDVNDLLRAFAVPEEGLSAVQAMVNGAQVVEDFREPPGEVVPPEYIPGDDPGTWEPAPNSPEDDLFSRLAGHGENDTGNGHRILDRFGPILMWAPGLEWFIYERGAWRPDETERTVKMAQLVAGEIWKEARFMGASDSDEFKARCKWSNKSQNATQVRSMLAMARPHIAKRAADLDADKWLFNAANGMVDLRTGKLLPHDPARLCTKQSPIPFDPEATAPTWDKFLRELFPLHPEMPAFMARAIGYALTGDTSEQCMFILYGLGSNGKSTLLDTLSSIFASYWRKTPAEAFMAQDRKGGAPNPDIAALRGIRFTTCSELEDGKRLSEALVKEATGDDTITVRGLYQDPITFTPMFKLFMGTNYKPDIRGTDPGIWRRIRLVPFLARFWDKKDPDAPHEGPFKDPMMLAKLRAELPGVLAWAVRGCLDWQRNNLNPPNVVMEATEHYREEMDTLGHFIEETCIRSPGGRVEMAHLYDAYTRWCADAGHQPMAKVKLGRKLTERGIENAPGSTAVRARSGLYLRSEWLPRSAANGAGYDPREAQGRFGDLDDDYH